MRVRVFHADGPLTLTLVRGDETLEIAAEGPEYRVEAWGEAGDWLVSVAADDALGATLVSHFEPEVPSLNAPNSTAVGDTLSLTGAGAEDVLARLVPVDLRGMGAAARSSLGHMGVILMRHKDGFELMVFRSMARTAWHEIEAAMKMQAARQAL